MDVVVVESPAKAKSIEKYLGPGYTVRASYGHVRDLVPKNGAVKPEEDFAMVWEVDPKAEKHLAEIARLLKGATHLYLATDPDREGEAISWHVQEVLRERKLLDGIDVKRVAFNEVTKRAVLEAIAHPRNLDRELVDAYLARRALDYLVGFTLSPVLWRKLPGSRSAGRVQSVALRLICERESEIEAFKAEEYWSVAAEFATSEGGRFTAYLTHLRASKLGKLGLPDKQAADAAVAAIAEGRFHVASIERKTVRRNPPPPFTTSTLQQESSRKLGLGASRTMQIAQRLYEGVDLGGETVGLITYMRTDGVQLSAEAIEGARDAILRDFGKEYLPPGARQYKSTAKNAQEAHEAIRPTDPGRRPSEVAGHLDRDQLRLYELIWKRALASQMESAQLDQTTVDVADESGNTVLHATGSIRLFDGFLKLYQEGRDDDGDEENGRRLPALREKASLTRGEIKPEQHFTQPLPRYTEASLVKRLEELGIGRPSTYASIIQVLQDRQYVRIDKRRFLPEDRGRLVTAFLSSFFERYVQYSFTAELENQLDEISGGRIDWKAVLRDFWKAFSEAVGGAKDLSIKQVISALDDALGPHFFPEDGSGKNPRGCPACGTGRLGLKLGRNGAFVGCGNYPECRYTRPLVVDQNGGVAADLASGPKELGQAPATGDKVTLRKGPYGIYVQMGEGEKPKRVSLPKGTDPAAMDLPRALALLALPREIGLHPESGDMITAGIGRFGPYLKLGSVYKSLGRDEDVLTIGINRAVELLATAKKSAGREIGLHPQDQKPVVVKRGRFGPYVQHSTVRATLRRDTDPDTLTLEQGLLLLQEKAAKGGNGKRAPGSRSGITKSGGAKSTAKGPAKAKPEAKAKKPPKTTKPRPAAD
ncbi:MAG: type I DNA topoisomerase [Proteobacteria bacterium]|nr:type I DNA topoisomerase [Pseudomonadota bacterium]